MQIIHSSYWVRVVTVKSAYNAHMTGDTSFAITKTDMLTFAEAPMHLWAFKRGIATPQLSAFALYLMEQGQKVEGLARGFLEAHVHSHYAEGQLSFQKTLRDGEFEARLDALVFDATHHVYDIYEVKSSTSPKKEHYADLAFQSLVAEANLTVRDCYLVLVNTDYVRNGEIDTQQLFKIEQVSEPVTAAKAEMRELRAQASATLQQEQPEGLAACYKPRQCFCPELCHGELPQYHIYDIPRLGAKKVDELRGQGIVDIFTLPSSFPLSENQQRYTAVVRSGQASMDKTAIQTELASMQYPLYFLDYEAFTPAVPLFDGYPPYRFITFQFSVHVVEAPGAPIHHYEYLNTQLQDPSEPLARHLSEIIGSQGSVVVWYRPFEGGRNKELAERLPAYASFFEGLNERIYDLMEIFSKNLYMDPECRGSSSIKNVLPVLCPDIDQSYEQLAINKGDQAMAAWLQVTSGTLSPAEAEEMREDMLQYCRLDTLAMLKVWERLHQLVA